MEAIASRLGSRAALKTSQLTTVQTLASIASRLEVVAIRLEAIDCY